MTGDSGTKGLDLESQVQKCVKDKNAHLIIVNVPTYTGDPDSLAAYQRLALKVVDIKDAGLLELKSYLVDVARKMCYMAIPNFDPLLHKSIPIRQNGFRGGRERRRQKRRQQRRRNYYNYNY